MDSVKEQFLLDRVVIVHGIHAGGFSAHHDLAVLECDDIRGPFNTHEFLVNPRNHPVAHDRHVDFRERTQRKPPVIAHLATEGHRKLRTLP